MAYIKLVDIAVAYYQIKHPDHYPDTKVGREKARKAFHTAKVLNALDIEILKKVIDELKEEVVKELDNFKDGLLP
jgi:hypothetical protein